MRMPSITKTSALLVLFCCLLLVAAGVLQYAWQLIPCPLCVLQRLVILLLGIYLIPGCLFVPMPTPRRWYYSVALLLASSGLGLSAWQVHLQLAPVAAAGSCGASLSYMLSNFPFMTVVHSLLQGSGECSDVQWTFLHVSLAEWSMLSFVILTGGCLWQMLRKSQ